MGAQDLRLQVILHAVDKATATLQKIQGGSSSTAKALRETRDRLKDLNTQQKAVSEFRELRTGLKATTEDLARAQDRVRQLAQRMGEIGPPTKAMAREFASAKREAASLGQQHDRQSQQAQILRDRLAAAGMSTSGLGTHERALRGQIQATTRSIEDQQTKLKALGERQRQMQAIGARYQKATGTAHGVAIRGAVAGGTGFALARGIHGPIEESKQFYTETQRIAALGMGEKVTADAIAYAKGMETYGTSTRDNLALVRDGLSVFADLHHAEMVAPTLAKMKFANEAIFGAEEGHENEKKFMDMLKVIELRGGLESEQVFKDQANKIQRVIAATGGRVQGEEWLNVIKTGGIAAKGLTDEALYYQMEPLVQEMGGNRVGTSMMSAYQNIYQGKTTKRAANMLDDLGLVADPSKVKHDKVGQIAQLGVGALKGSDIFRHNQFEWMEKILLPQLAKKGITEKQQILDTIGGIFSNRTASNLFGQMYLQRDQIHKNAKLNAGADDIDQLYGKAVDSPGGKEIDLDKRKADLYKAMGDTIMPTYVRALEMAAAALKRFTAWTEANPRTAKAMAIGLAAVALGLVAIGGAAIALAPLLIGMAATRMALSMLGVQGSALGFVMRGLFGSLRFVLMAIVWIGRALLMNPIGLTITAIAAAAFLIYKYWGPISAFFTKLWGDVRTGFDTALAWIQALPMRFYDAGAEIMRGLGNGITGALGSVRESIVGAADAALSWFKEKLGIRSPSRLFMLAGEEVGNGAALGIANREGLVRQAAAGLALATAGALPLGAMAATGAPLDRDGPRFSETATRVEQAQRIVPAFQPDQPLRMDQRPPLSAPALQQQIAPAGDNIAITINAAPGMDAQAIARAVSAELDRRYRERGARRGSALYD